MLAAPNAHPTESSDRLPLKDIKFVNPFSARSLPAKKSSSHKAHNQAQTPYSNPFRSSFDSTAADEKLATPTNSRRGSAATKKRNSSVFSNPFYRSYVSKPGEMI